MHNGQAGRKSLFTKGETNREMGRRNETGARERVSESRTEKGLGIGEREDEEEERRKKERGRKEGKRVSEKGKGE